jgi:hypothetical protein
MRREEGHVTRRVMNMNMEGWRGRGRPKNRWIDWLRLDMRLALSDEMMSECRPQVNWEMGRKKKKTDIHPFICLFFSFKSVFLF